MSKELYMTQFFLFFSWQIKFDLIQIIILFLFWLEVDCSVTPNSKPSSTPLSKFQHGGKVPTFKPQEIIEIWFIFIKVESWLFHEKKLVKLALKLGPTFWLTQLSWQVPSLGCENCYQVGTHYILGTCVEWQVPTSMLSMVEIARIGLKWPGGLGLGSPCEPALSTTLCGHQNQGQQAKTGRVETRDTKSR
jgi:hypothetical protein